MTTTTDQTTRRPRRAPSPPRIDEHDRPPEEELQHARAQLARSTRPNRFIRSR